MKRKTCLIVIFISFVSLLNAQSLTLSVSSKTIGSKDALQVTYSFKNVNLQQAPDISFEGWTVEEGPDVSHSYQNINGQSSTSLDLTYVLIPTHTGTLVVPGISVSVSGKKISCNPAAVNVSSKAHLQNDNNDQSGNNPYQQIQQMQQQMQQQMSAIFGNMDDNMPQPDLTGIIVKPGQSLEDAARGKVFIKVIPSKTTCYLGEPISVNYEIYSNVNCTANPVHIPSFGSFSVTDINQNNAVYSVNVDGKNYRAQTIRKAQLTALKTGDLRLDSAVLSCRINYTEATDPGNVKTGNITIKSNLAIIHVLPLPDKNKPADFSGAVGSFAISASPEKINLPAEENNTLHIQITGTGTLDNVSQPQINFPEIIQAFDAKDSQSIDKSTFPMPVTRVFDIPFIGNEKGNAIIPPIKFTYFDTKKNDYQTISTDSIKIVFTTPLHHDYKSDKEIINDEGNKKYLWILAIVVIVALLYYFIKEKFSKNTTTDSESLVQPVKIDEPIPTENIAIIPEEINNKEALLQDKKDKLSEAFSHLESETDSHQFFVLAKALLIQYLQDKLDSNSIDENELLHEVQIKYPEEYNGLMNLFTRCNKALYLPIVSATEHDEILKRIKILVHSFIYSVNL